MRFTFPLVLGLALAVGLGGQAAAQSIKVGVFDPNKILTNSKLGQRLQDDLNKFRVEREAGIKADGEELKRLVDQYKAGADNMSDERRETIEADLLQRRRDLERAAKDAELELTRRRQKAIRDLEEQVQLVLQDYGRQNGYTLILQRDLVAYVPDTVDISDDIIRLVDARTN